MTALKSTRQSQGGEELTAVHQGMDAAPGHPIAGSSSIPIVFLFLTAYFNFMNFPQRPAASANQHIGADQLVRAAVHNELQAENGDQTYWRYWNLEEKNGRKELRDVFETKYGQIDRLVSVNDQPLTLKQTQMEDDRINKLLAEPDKMHKQQEQRHQEDENERKLLKLLPDVFRYQYDGTEGDLMKLTLTPNPNFHPYNRQTKVLHHIRGAMWIDRKQVRLARIDGCLTADVRFGGGLLGHLDKGGTFSVTLEDVGSGHWEMILLVVRMKGSALIFKTIDLQEKELYTNYQPIPAGMTLQQAAQLLKKDAHSLENAAISKN